MTQKWFSAAQLAAFALPELPNSARGIALKARREGWHAPDREGEWWRNRRNSGGGVEFSTTALPVAARIALLLKLEPPATRARVDAVSRADVQARWEWFGRQSGTKQDAARRRLRILQAVRSLTDAGMLKVHAVEGAARDSGVSVSTIYAWETLVHRLAPFDWLPFLAPRHVGAPERRAECSEEAWHAFKKDWLRVEQPNISDCYRRTKELAALNGWVMPSEKTMARRLKTLPFDVRVLGRQGEEALDRSMPAQTRDRSALHAMEAWNADFHKWDVWVEWPGQPKPIRPQMMALQDIYSGKIVGFKFDISPNKHTVRLCLGEAIEKFGVPDHMVLDNGREFAAKDITGQTERRNRFKVTGAEPVGLLVELDVQVHWAQVYHGQSKPIERAFRDMAQSIAKHPDFEGCWTGNSPATKPEYDGQKAVPHDVFVRRVSIEIAKHNAREGRTGGVCAGRSFDQVFAESYAKSIVRKVTEAQRGLWLMTAQALTVDRQDGCITVHGNRFHADFLDAYRGQKVVARFDPQRLRDDVHVYRMDNAFLGTAPCLVPTGFFDAASAQDHARNKTRKKRATREQVAAERGMAAAQAGREMPAELPESPLPEARVVRLVMGNTVRQAAPDELPEQTEEERQWLRGMRAQHGLRVVTGADD